MDALTHLIGARPAEASYAEARFQCRKMSEVVFVNGELQRIRTVDTSGCGTRVLAQGCWGFSSSADASPESLRSALAQAVSLARVLAEGKKNQSRGLAQTRMMAGEFRAPANGDLSEIDMEQKVKIAREAEAAARRHDRSIKTASCTYREILDHKIIVNTDGAAADIYDSKPEFNVSAVAKSNGQSATASASVGITGGWKDLFAKKSHLDYALESSEKAMRLVAAKHPEGERTTIILDPGMVGLLAHEAIGHTVEADFVLSGSVAKDRVGEQVASELVTLVDSGTSEFASHAGGSIPVDDEGVEARRVPIIEKGILKSYLHNRESARIFETEPTGNARAFDFSDEPLIRMRNTFFEPGNAELDEMVKETRHGYLIRGARNGQADANGEFMFGAQEAYLIEGGQVRQLLRGASVSGRAFEVLASVDMVGKVFEYDMGGGYCGKYQLAKVDGGGPYLRCTAIIGGLQGQN